MIVISGGQTGADQAGLYAAKECGLSTGGWAPKGWRTLGGTNQEVLQDFGLEEHPSSAYNQRTEANVELADVTIRLAFNFKSRGEICTLNAIKKYNQGRIDIDLNKPLPNPFRIAQLLKFQKVKILNIAGNGDGPQNGEVFDIVKPYLINVFNQWKKF